MTTQSTVGSQKMQINWQRAKYSQTEKEARELRKRLRASGWYERNGIPDGHKEADEAAERGLEDAE